MEAQRYITIKGKKYWVGDDIKLGDLLFHIGGDHYFIDTKEKFALVKTKMMYGQSVGEAAKRLPEQIEKDAWDSLTNDIANSEIEQNILDGIN